MKKMAWGQAMAGLTAETSMIGLISSPMTPLVLHAVQMGQLAILIDGLETPTLLMNTQLPISKESWKVTA